MGRALPCLRTMVKWGIQTSHAPVAQLDRVSPSEGEGHRFESCRVRQNFNELVKQPMPLKLFWVAPG